MVELQRRLPNYIVLSFNLFNILYILKFGQSKVVLWRVIVQNQDLALDSHSFNMYSWKGYKDEYQYATHLL
jgi:hypothetical protein